uniref:Uncharacterized protein n=1 Tax=Myoviridae sp. ctpjm1 TaxID=2826699 RepID=A0A8S5NMZ1_9CAUD|nr:MAG TPA: hypothetical protein [Myoviridae sp. ctpjm1]DAQ10780.1 MAG TPA: hypothetical protein [Caudoviricetes sp.]DAY46011.1 MAG TPA: hypothetical protein [Caudoviricetes sp.]
MPYVEINRPLICFTPCNIISIPAGQRREFLYRSVVPRLMTDGKRQSKKGRHRPFYC